MLLYAWFKDIDQEQGGAGVIFAKKFQIEYLAPEYTLVMTRNEKFIPHFFGKNIEDINALAGQNGAGKTQFCKRLFGMLENPSGQGYDILVFMEDRKIYVYCSDKQIHTIRFEQEQFDLTDKKKETASGFELVMHPVRPFCPVVPFMVTNAFAPDEINAGTITEGRNFRSVAYNLQNVCKWEQMAYGTAVGQFLHNNSSAFARAKINSPLEEYKIYQSRLMIKNYITAKDLPIFQKMNIYQEFQMGIRSFEGHILFENADQKLKEQCNMIVDGFRKLGQVRGGIMESAYMMFLEEACLYFPEIMDMVRAEILKWLHADGSIIDPKFNALLLNEMKKSYHNGKAAQTAGEWEWLQQAERLFGQLEKWQRDPDKKDLFQYLKGRYRFDSEEGEKLLDFYMEVTMARDSFWKRAIGFSLNGCSSGELAAVNLFAYITDIFYSLDRKQEGQLFFIIIDEIDIGLHPKWQQGILKYLVEFLGQRFPEYRFQLFITSHSPIVLSDIPSDRVYLIRRKEEADTHRQIEACEKETFGANIYNLFYDGFFMDEGTIGTFAQETIDAVISWLQGKAEKEFSQEEADSIIEYIGEPVVRERLRIMSRKLRRKEENRI